MKFIYRKALFIYLQTVKNEIYIDQFALNDTKINQIINYELIRTYHLQGYAIKHPIALKMILNIASRTWFLIHPLLVFVQSVRLLPFFLKGEKTKQNKNISKIIFLSTPKMIDQIKKVNPTELPSYFLTFNYSISKHNNYISIYQTLTLKTLLKSIKLAIISPYLIKRINKNKIHKLQSYTSFKWMVAWFTINAMKIEEIWFGNHFDRWAILCDNLKNCKKFLVQHGIENGTLVPPVKLKNIDVLYLLNKNQAGYFKDKIIKSNFEIRLLKNALQLSPFKSTHGKAVLIVGNTSLTLEYEKELIKKLQNINIDILLKPHPVLPFKEYYTLLSKYTFTIIEQKDIFPKVDIVISYESTLGFEYEMEGIKVLYYQNYTIDNMVNEINNLVLSRTS